MPIDNIQAFPFIVDVDNVPGLFDDILELRDVLNTTIDEVNTLMSATGGTVFISATDTTADYLDASVTAGTGISTTILNPSADEDLEIALDLTASLTWTGSHTFSSAIAANGGITFDQGTDTLNGIQVDNLLDSSATETVTGAWTFSSQIALSSGAYSYGNLDFAYGTSTLYGTQVQNLVDKTATETISGAWTFTTKPTTTAGIAVTGGSVEMGGSGTVVWASTGMTIDNDEISLPDGHRGIEFHKNVGTPTPADSFWLVSSLGAVNALNWDWNPGTYGATAGLMLFGDAVNNVNTSHRGKIVPAVTKTYSIGEDVALWGSVWGYRGYFGTANFSASGGSTLLFGETANSSHVIEGTAAGTAAFGATTGNFTGDLHITASGRGSFATGNVQTSYYTNSAAQARVVASGLGTRAHGWVYNYYGSAASNCRIVASGNAASAFGGINASSPSDYQYIMASGAGTFVAGYLTGSGTSRFIKAQGPGGFIHAHVGPGATNQVLASGTGNFIHGASFSVGSVLTASGTGSAIIASASAGDVTSSGNGSLAVGIATAGDLVAAGDGSVVMGDASGGNISAGSAGNDGNFAGGFTTGTGSITSNADGSFAWGYATAAMSATGKGAVALGGGTGTGAITASGNGSCAVGFVPSTVSIVASAQNSAQFFPGSNAEIGALGVGIRGSGGIRLCSLDAPAAKYNGDVWVQYSGGSPTNLVYIRSAGTDVPIRPGGSFMIGGTAEHKSSGSAQYHYAGVAVGNSRANGGGGGHLVFALFSYAITSAWCAPFNCKMKNLYVTYATGGTPAGGSYFAAYIDTATGTFATPGTWTQSALGGKNNYPFSSGGVLADTTNTTAQINKGDFVVLRAWRSTYGETADVYSWTAEVYPV